jgi:hypothetical protein
MVDAGLDLTVFDETLTCPNCSARQSTGEAESELKVSVAPLGAAGPLVSARWGGECPRFRLLTAYCPRCAKSVESLQLRVEG